MSVNQTGTTFKYGIQTGDPVNDTGIKLIKKIKVLTAVLSPVAVAINTTAEQALTVTGLEASDIILTVVKPTAQAGLGIVGTRVSAANTLAITFSNNTAGSITPTASETYTVIAVTYA